MFNQFICSHRLLAEEKKMDAMCTTMIHVSFYHYINENDTVSNPSVVCLKIPTSRYAVFQTLKMDSFLCTPNVNVQPTDDDDDSFSTLKLSLSLFQLKLLTVTSSTSARECIERCLKESGLNVSFF